jgi:hypothetical protein
MKKPPRALERRPDFRVFSHSALANETSRNGRREMNRRDQELLDKQMRRFGPAPRRDGTMMLALVAVFLAGMTIGAFAFAYKSDPVRIATNSVLATNEAPITVPPIAR